MKNEIAAGSGGCMRRFDYVNASTGCYSAQCEALAGEISECKGRAQVVKRIYPDLLCSLEERAFVDTLEAAVRLEGQNIARSRVEELASGAPFSNDLESQVSGCARALRRIDAVESVANAEAGEKRVAPEARRHIGPDLALRAEALRVAGKSASIEPRDVLDAHADVFFARPSSGKSLYRARERMRVVIDGVEQEFQVSPVAAYETPLYLGAALDSLEDALSSNPRRALVLIAMFLVDFTCIRPFDEGTGRIARLAARQLMLRCGYDACRFVSVDALLARDPARYYEVLNACAEGWEHNANTYEPFVVYLMETVKEAYDALFAATPLFEGGHPSKTERVRLYFDASPGRHTKRDVASACPDISVSTIEAALGGLVKSGYLRMVGGGRSAAYERIEG